MRLQLPATAINVSLVRAAVGALAARAGAEDALMQDVRTAIGEAANNVVVHAYGGAPGPLCVEARVSERELLVTVRDEGPGIAPREPVPADMPGIGLSLIQALASAVEFHRSGEGTAAQISFRPPQALRPPGGVPLEGGGPMVPGGLDDLLLDVTVPLIGPLVGSLAGALGARGQLSIERLGDLRLLADALAAHLPAALATPTARIALRTSSAYGAAIEIDAGPLHENGASEVVTASAVGGLPPLLRHLASAIDAEHHDGHEWLRLAMLADRDELGRA